MLTFAIGVPIYMIGRRAVGAWVGVRVGHERGDEPHRARALTIAAGPAANYLVAMLLFFGIIMATGIPGPPSRIEITQVAPNRPAAAAGLLPGDHILAVGELTVDPTAGSGPIIEVLEAHEELPLSITVLRDGHTLVQTVTPSAEGKVGIGFEPRGSRISVGVGTAAAMAVERPIVITQQQLVGLYEWATGRLDTRMQGPVGIAKTAAYARQDESVLLRILGVVAITSTMFGVIVLLPLPGCAGGRMILLLYEVATRRRIGPPLEAKIHRYGVLALFALLVLVTLVDLFGVS